MKQTITGGVNPGMREMGDVYALQQSDVKTLTTQLDYSFRKNETAQFASEGASGGRPWPALSAQYARQKARQFPGRKIMTRTGKGRKTLVNKSNPLHVAIGRLKPRAVVELGTDYTPFSYHTGPFKNPRVPERDVMQVTAHQVNRYEEIIAEHYRTVTLPRVMRKLIAEQRNIERQRVKVA